METTSLEELYFTRRKLEEEIDQSVIHAPVDGTIEELQIHSTERTVQETERLMKIVPTDQAIKVEALIPSKDICWTRLENTSTKV